MPDLLTEKQLKRAVAARDKAATQRVASLRTQRDTRPAGREAAQRLRAARAEFARRHASP